MSAERYSRLAPLQLEQRKNIALAALDFFSPISYEKVSAAIDRSPTPGRTEPFDGSDFLTYLEKTGVLSDSRKYSARIRDLLEKLESTGLLTYMGQGRDVLIGKRYYFLKELTALERKGLLWTAPALGPEFLYSVFSTITAQITGTGKEGDAHAGTALAIAPNWLLTCAHVINDMEIDEEQTILGRPYRVVRKLSHKSIDVGLIQVEQELTVIDALAFRDPFLSEPVFTFGFPFVPLAREPALIMQRGEVTSTNVKLLDGRDVFLYSAIARPGNSGGPILSESGHVLGIVTEQLERQGMTYTLPFHAGVSAATISSAIAEIQPSLQLPVENYA